MPDTHRKNTSQLRGGVMKRGTTWSNVTRKRRRTTLASLAAAPP